jgi:hypothetical protein
LDVVLTEFVDPSGAATYFRVPDPAKAVDDELAVFSTALAAGGAEPIGGRPAAEADFHVAPNGNDANPGTADAPFATMARARNAVRQKVAAGLTADMLVLIRGGTYRQNETLVFGPEDSGTEKCSVTYAAYPGERVMLSGGRRITGWKRGEGDIWTTELPEAKAGQWYFRQLFVDGKRAVRARTPNIDDKTPWWKITTSSAKRGAPDQNSLPIVVGVDHPIRPWKNTSDVELIYLNNNDGSRKRVGAVNEGAQTCTLPPPHQWPPDSLPGEYQIGHPVPPYACYFENALEMLDEAGEWYLDRRTGVLSYWARDGEDLTKAEVVAPVVQKTLLAVAGTAEKRVRNLRFKGITVEHVDWPLPPYGFTSMFGCLQVTSDGGKPPIRFCWIDAAVGFKFARECDFTDGGVAHVGGIGLSLLSGCAQNVIEGNHLHDLGGGGITAGAILNRDTWKWADPLAPDDHKTYRIANNYVHHCGTDYFGAIGIFVGCAQEVLVTHNLVHDVAYSGIVLSGNETPLKFARNNTVEFNHIHHAMRVAVDGAGIYVSFPHEGWGAAVRGNLIHDLVRNPFNPRDAGGWDAAGIYLDGVRPDLGCKSYQIESNVVYKTSSPLFLNLGGGSTWLDNVLQQDGTPPREFIDAMEAATGLEAAYRRSILNATSPACVYYSLAEPSDSGWSARQFNLGEAGKGVIEVFRRGGSTATSWTFKARRLNSLATYEFKIWVSDPIGEQRMFSGIQPVADVGTVLAQGVTRRTGRQLMEDGLLVKLDKQPQIAWIAYQSVE